MLLQAGHHRHVGGAGILRPPVVRHPFLDQGRIERALAAQHQVDARGLVQEVGLGEVAAHLRFQPPHQARQQGVAQGVPIDRIGAGAQLGRLRKVEARQDAAAGLPAAC